VIVSQSVEVTDPPEMARGLVLVKASGGVRVTVLARVPVNDGLMVATTVYVTAPPAGIDTRSSILPDPEEVKPVAPPVPVAVHVSFVKARIADTGS
jgi:hypothetical protein